MATLMQAKIIPTLKVGDRQESGYRNRVVAVERETMQKRKLGQSDLEVSAIGFGCIGMISGYGPAGEKQEIHSPIRSTVERCGAFFDTAEGKWPQMWKGWLVSALLATLMISSASAQQLPSYIDRPPDAAGIFAIWPGSGVPPGAEKWTWREQTMQAPGNNRPSRMVRNVVIPTVTMFKPSTGTANGTSLIVAPGGAFHFLMMDHEGYEVAHWLTKLGITAFVLKYRVQHTPENDADMPAFLKKLGEELPRVEQAETYPPMSNPGAEEARLWGEEDRRQAARFLRQNAKELGIDPNRIGIMGFSAGGGIAVNAALKPDSLSRPDFVGGIYPGYRIVGPVPKDLPPLFIAITDDDKYVAPISSSRLYEDWHKVGKSVELHIFANGRHGFGMNKQDLLSDQWLDLFKNWMAAQGFLSPAKK